MKILLLGKNGQLGWELQRALAPLGDLLALDKKGSLALCGDLTDLEGLSKTLSIVNPDIIVNAAAYTAVDKAETETAEASLINAEAVKLLADEAANRGAWLVHYSTDYVFDGTGIKPWGEVDLVNPLNYYGNSKLAGEQAINASGCQHLLFRTSWVYGVMGNNFAKSIIRLASQKEQLRIVADQIGVPTGADLLADLTAHSLYKILKNPELGGTYHVAPRGEVSWYEYADFIVKKMQSFGEALKIKSLIPISTAEYPTPAKRPLNSRLSTAKLTDSFSFHLPEWEVGVSRMLREFFGRSA